MSSSIMPGNCLMMLLLVLCCVLASVVLAVDRSKFKTCSDSGFCKRNRALGEAPTTDEDGSSWGGPNPGRYQADWASAKQVGDRVELLLRDVAPDAEALAAAPLSGDPLLLRLEVRAYEGGIVRLQLRESYPEGKSAPRARYEVPGVVLPSLKGAVARWQPETRSVALPGGALLRLGSDPGFYVELVDAQGERLLTANARGLMNVERSRPRPEEPVNNRGQWEENFGSHADSKPHGPMSIGMDFTWWGSDNLYGVPSHATDLRLRPTRPGGDSGVSPYEQPYRLYNLDVFEYEVDSEMALYGHVPLMLSHTKDKGTSAVFWLNAAETWVDVLYKDGNAETHWMSESGVMDMFFLVGPTPKDVTQQYAAITGTAELPPVFAIAYHQCKWNYKSEAEVAEVDSGYDQWDIPYDVIWLDIEHTDAKKYFTWDSRYFPTPESMQDAIAAKGRKMVTIVDPHIKRDNNYPIHTEAEEKGLYVKNKDGKDYEGWCWPGSSSWLDFTDANIRQWWSSKFAYDQYKGSTNVLYTWNDMNEPSVFNGPEVTMHKDVLHAGGWEHRDVHNVYGMLMHDATSKGLEQRNPGANERPFVLSRAFFAGTQRIGAIWTGDNGAEWEHLKISQPMLLSLSLTGITFSGADVGGFFGNPDPQLLTRWYQAGALQPFFRAHAHLDAKRREPWLAGEPWVSSMRQAIRLRYRLLPFFYTLFREAYDTGLPVMRPLFMEFPDDEKTFTEQDVHMLGSQLLCSPVLEADESSITRYLPGSQGWYEFPVSPLTEAAPSYKLERGGEVTIATPLEKIPMYLRGGSILPTQERTRRASSQMRDDPYTLTVAPSLSGSVGAASGTLYIDDQRTFDHRKGAFAKVSFVFQDGKLTARREGGVASFQPVNTVERVVILGQSAVPSSVLLSTDSGVKELTFSWDEDTSVLVVRKPDIPVASAWSISLK